ncbi:MAG TPA: SGNH/GDSL hydrolase family protein [Prosthecobacter sp.]|nr:SGNH/GDSL hydrolase family protein [Prosthecobacter sp.]
MPNKYWPLVVFLALAPLHGAEPTNAAELAEKKAVAEKIANEKFAAWKATLPAEQQAWETVLEQNLGSFYLPLYKNDKLRGTPTAWDYVVDDPKLPRALLIGDSISRGYTLPVRKALAGKVNVHRAPENCGPTANALKKLPVWLGSGRWDVIHFNFGIHDRKTPLPEYEQRLGALAAQLKATGAKVIWASTTPVMEGGMKDATDADLVARNAAAAKVMQRHGIPIDDLYNWIKADLAQYQNPKDVHFSAAGYDRLGERVARVLEVAAPAPDQAKNTALVPVAKLETDGYGWEKRHAAAMKLKDTLKPEIVLIGDSITHFWGGEPAEERMGNRGAQAWQDLFGDRSVVNLGFGWDRTQNVLKRIEMGELDGLQPKAVVLHIGTNNLARTVNARDNTPAEIAEAIGVIMDRIQTKCPGTQIILMAVFPRGQSLQDPKRALIAEINKLLAPLAAAKSRVTFLDLTVQWLQADGTLSKEIMPDFLHPNEKGYAIWAGALRKVLPN